MDLRISKIAFGFYLLLALLGFGGLFAYLSHIQQHFTDRMDQVASEMETGGPLRRPPVLLGRHIIPPAPATSTSSEIEKILELRELLDERTRLLEQRSDELAKTTTEYRKLGEENDRYLKLLSDLTKQNDAAITPVAEETTEVARTNNEDLDLLEWALTEAQETIGMLEAAQLQQRELVNAIETSIVAAGPAAIPVLLSVLTSDRADLRIWAATLLGRLGPLAFEASDPLRVVSAEDQDPNVRRTAAWAVRQIDGSFE